MIKESIEKVLLESNVVIAAFASRGLCRDLFEYCLYEHFLVTSQYILEEVHKNLCAKIKVPRSITDTIVKFITLESEIVIPNDISQDACRDPKDLPILGTALSGQVDVIVTGDDDLLTLEKFQNIPIVKPRKFWEFIQKQE